MKVVIVALSVLIATLADWRWPAVEHLTRETLLRARGPLPAPGDIAIVAIDTHSIAELGPFPWPRSRTARVIDAVASAAPKVITLDILYANPTTPAEDDALAASITHAGNVVLPAELQEPEQSSERSEWLLPLPELASGAAGLGHNRVAPAPDGKPRELPIRVAAASGRNFYALALETIRVADRTPARSVSETPRTVNVGRREIAVDNSSSERRMAIDYIGPAGAFKARTCSFADVLSGHTPPSTFRNKYVLIGATASALGADSGGMPGIEVLANSVATILDSRFYAPPSDAGSIVFNLAVAALTMFLFSRPRLLVIVPTAVLAAGYLAFTRLQTLLPVGSGVIAFAVTVLLSIIWRRLRAAPQRITSKSLP